METTLDFLGGGGLPSKVPSNYQTEDELELGLALSPFGGDGNSKESLCAEQHGRILTAKDFPNGFSRKSTSGTKRAADSVAPSELGSPDTSNVSQVVGWPPIGAYRMNSLVNQAKTPSAEEDKFVGGKEKSWDSLKKFNHGSNNQDTADKEIKCRLGFVKVNIDGLAIGRKVDLNAHSCYMTLAQALEEMFFGSTRAMSSLCVDKEQARNHSKLLDGSSKFVLTYEDKEGDWMLVGDVPWGMFLSTVRRLRIMKISESSGVAPKFQERDGKQRRKPI